MNKRVFLIFAGIGALLIALTVLSVTSVDDRSRGRAVSRMNNSDAASALAATIEPATTTEPTPTQFLVRGVSVDDLDVDTTLAPTTTTTATTTTFPLTNFNAFSGTRQKSPQTTPATTTTAAAAPPATTTTVEPPTSTASLRCPSPVIEHGDTSNATCPPPAVTMPPPTKRAKRCVAYDSSGTIHDFNAGSANSATNFQGSPLIHAAAIPDPGPSATYLDVRYMCDDYRGHAPSKAGPVTPGCHYVDANTLVATRLFNVFDRSKIIRALELSSNVTFTKECIKRERKRVREVAAQLIQDRRFHLKDRYLELRDWFKYRGAPAPTTTTTTETTATSITQAAAGGSFTAASPGRGENKEKKKKTRRGLLEEQEISAHMVAAYLADKNLTATTTTATTTTATTSAAPTTKPLRPTLPRHKRKRLLVCVAMERRQPTWRGATKLREDELHKPVAHFKEMLRSFLAVARPDVDELHWLTDYYAEQWPDFLLNVRKEEDVRRRHLWKIKMDNIYNNNSKDHRRRAASSSSFSDPFNNVELNNVASDGMAAARVVLWDTSTWRRKLKYTFDDREPPLTTRIYYIQHLGELLANEHGEHEGTIAMMIFADTRDILYQTNPFDAVLELDLNRGDIGAPPPEERTVDKNYFRGLFAAEEGSSHCCTYLFGGPTPKWEQTFLGEQATLKAMCGDREMPDGAYPPILCSGYWGGDFAAVRDFFDLHALTTKCSDGRDLWGADQGSFSVSIYYGLSATEFPHDVFILSANVGPVRHFHYLQSNQFPIYVGPDNSQHLYLNCAGRPMSVLHQLDRKVRRYTAWNDMLNSRFKNLTAAPTATATASASGGRVGAGTGGAGAAGGGGARPNSAVAAARSEGEEEPFA